MAVNINLGHNVSLDAIEAAERNVCSNNERVHIKLARDLGNRFFIEASIASLMAGASRRGTLTVTDWGSKADRDLASRLAQSPEGVAAALYANDITLDDKALTPVDATGVVAKIIDQGGFGEATADEISHGARLRALTIYAFDDLDPIPLVLSGTDIFSRFKEKFETLRRRYFEVGAGQGYSDRIGQNLSDKLTRYAFEIYQNTYRHGRLSEHNRTIAPGMRYLRLKRHISSSKPELIERAAGFSELQEYVESRCVGRKRPVFYEVAISDHGLGIADRFLATCPKYRIAAMDREFRQSLVNKIVEDSLSSNSALAGAGNGLRNAIRDVDSLGGFLSIRSGDIWMYRSSISVVASATSMDLSRALAPASKQASIVKTCGTQVNMLFPLGAF